MIVLGLNEGHMSSAALVKDGKLLAAACEERFTRKKNEMGFPKESIKFCLDYTKIKKEDIDYVATVTNDLPAFNEAIKRYPNFTLDDYLKENRDYWKPLLLDNKEIDYFSLFPKIKNDFYDFSFLDEEDKSKWNELFKIERQKNIQREFELSKEKVIFVDHHTSHASYGYYMSPFRNDVLILTADAFGDGCNCSISLGHENTIETKFKSPNHNLARLYKYITLLMGMKPNEHEYKVMGLAPYASDYIIEKPYEIFSSTQYVDGLDFKYNVKPTDNYFWFKEKLEGCRFDGIAGALQKYAEEIMKKWVENAMSHFDKQTIVFSGGLAMNIKINKIISEINGVNNLFVAGGGGDESLSIGAAIFHSNQINSKISFQAPLHDYHGPEIDDQSLEKIMEIKGLLSEFNLKHTNNLEIAELLSQNYVIGRCKGRSEFGPRSLGNRSILANPSKVDNLKKINEKIKFRDFWMPFTPSILIEQSEKYVINPKNILSPYMTIGFDSTEQAKVDLVAAIHPADQTLRPQFVEKSTNPEYHDLISKFEKLTGIGGLLNTSLNLHGEPIVGNVDDAIHTLLNSDLDALVINDYLISRKR